MRLPCSGGKGIRVNGIAPGVVKTEMFSTWGVTEKVRQAPVETTPPPGVSAIQTTFAEAAAWLVIRRP